MTFEVGERVRINDNYSGLWTEARGREGVVTFIQTGDDDTGEWTLYHVEVRMDNGQLRKAVVYPIDIEPPMLAEQTQDLINLIESLGG